MSESKNSYSLGMGSWMFIQVALLVIHYGFKIALPLWVLWFPSIIVGSIIVIVGIVFIILFLIAWVK